MTRIRSGKEARDANDAIDGNYYHLNSVQELPSTPLGSDPRFRPGNLLVSFRNVSMIAILERQTKRVAWSWGPGILDHQHMPWMLANGNILIFDNGSDRGYSKVVEINPETNGIVWEYPPKEARFTFYSRLRGSAQRLENGNTLICESDNGRAFEVTPAGETVWEFWNPFINSDGKRRYIYRMIRENVNPSVFAKAAPVPITSLDLPGN